MDFSVVDLHLTAAVLKVAFVVLPKLITQSTTFFDGCNILQSSTWNIWCTVSVYLLVPYTWIVWVHDEILLHQCPCDLLIVDQCNNHSAIQCIETLNKDLLASFFVNCNGILVFFRLYFTSIFLDYYPFLFILYLSLYECIGDIYHSRFAIFLCSFTEGRITDSVATDGELESSFSMNSLCLFPCSSFYFTCLFLFH